MLIADFALGIFGKLGKLLKEALHFRPDLEAPAGITFQSFSDDTG
ncbi:hypothetical protein [Nitrosomonas ureae]|nr:hypothetical protein [Nitrosomonas ureae]